MAKKDAGGFNTPFEKLGRLAKQPPPAKPVVAPASAPVKPPPARPPAPPVGNARPAPETDDDRSFEQAMRGATPLAAGERGRRASPLAGPGSGAAPARRRTTARAIGARDDEADALAELADLVSEGGERATLKELRRGRYPIEADLDLHGHSRAEAVPRLERFIALSLDQGRRCVRVIHGRGLHSQGEEPVLREAVQRTLAGGGPDGHAVLAFTLAPPAHGGDGATLVLLRRKKTRA